MEANTLRWMDEGNTILAGFVKFDGAANFIPFDVVNPADTPYGQDFWDRATAGEFGEIKPYDPNFDPATVYVADIPPANSTNVH